MANELKASYVTGRTLYCLIFDNVGRVWNTGTGALESYLTANLANYAVGLTGVGAASSLYLGNFPGTAPPGIYDVVAKNQQGGSPAESDPTVASEDGFSWNGSVRLSLSDLVTSGQLSQLGPIRLARGVAVRHFPVYLKSSLDHSSPLISGIVSGQIARDGGAFGPLQSGAFTETGLGFYDLLALTSGDMLADTIKLLFTGVGISGGASDPFPLAIVTQKTSGGV